MAKAKSKVVRYLSPEEQSAGKGNWFTRAFFHPELLFVLAIGVAAAVLVPRMLRTMPDWKNRRDFVVETSDIRITPPPPWMPENFARQVCEQAGFRQKLCILDDKLVPRLTGSLERSPWVKQVVQVRKGYPAQVWASVEYRRPVAMVRSNGGVYPVDAEGVLLPSEGFPVELARRFPLIENIDTLPAGGPGHFWGDERVVAAVRVILLLDMVWERHALRSIAVSPRSEPPLYKNVQLVLVTAHGSRIIWGRPPESLHPAELSDEKKLLRLEEYAMQYGNLHQELTPYEINIARWQAVTRRPLAANTTMRFE